MHEVTHARPVKIINFFTECKEEKRKILKHFLLSRRKQHGGIKAVSLRQAAFSSCCIPTIAWEQDPLTQELGEDLVTARAANSQGVPTPCFSKQPWSRSPGALEPSSLRAPGHLCPASRSIMQQSMSIFISLYSFILESVYLKA